MHQRTEMTQQVPSPRTGTSDNDRINVAPNTQPQPQPRRFHENLTTEQAGHQGLAPAGIAPAQTPKSGWEIAYELLGFPLSWHSNAGVRYTDSQSYPLRPTSNTSQAYPRCDAELTKDGQSLVPLVVQAADYLEHERNSTWQRHSITAVTTVMMKISQSPLLAKARFESNFKDKSWVTWGAWTYYVFHWHIVGQVGVWVWFVSLPPSSI